MWQDDDWVRIHKKKFFMQALGLFLQPSQKASRKKKVAQRRITIRGYGASLLFRVVQEGGEV